MQEFLRKNQCSNPSILNKDLFSAKIIQISIEIVQYFLTQESNYIQTHMGKSEGSRMKNCFSTVLFKPKSLEEELSMFGVQFQWIRRFAFYWWDNGLDSKCYKQILIHHLVPKYDWNIERGFVFQQDNDKKIPTRLILIQLRTSENWWSKKEINVFLASKPKLPKFGKQKSHENTVLILLAQWKLE